MSTNFDQYAINHMIVAINEEMTPLGAKRHADFDTLFMGGTQPTESEQTDLANFGLSQNYNIVFPSFDAADPSNGPIDFHAVYTDGETVAVTVPNGRLWKRDRRTAAILVFPSTRTTVKLSTKGRMILRGTTGEHHAAGFDLAREAIIARASKKPGHMPVVSTIGNVLTVCDIKIMSATFAAAA